MRQGMKPALKKLSKEPSSINSYELERHLRRFCQVTSHELGNLLGAVYGELDFGLTSQNNADRERSLEVAFQAAEKALVLCRNLQYFAIQTRVDGRIIDLSQLVLDTIEDLENEFEQRGIQLQVFVETQVVTVVDEGAFQQALTHLLNSFKDRLSAHHQVTLTLRQNKNSIDLEIQDNGRNIPEEKLAELFDPQFFTPNTLGISVAKAILDGHGGDLQIENLPQRGVRYLISLPIDSKIGRKPYPEKRQHRRITLDLPAVLFDKGRDTQVLVRIATLGEGGCLALLPEGVRYPDNKGATLSIELEHFSSRTVSIPKASILYHCKLGTEVGLGIEFGPLPERTLKVLRALIRSHAMG